MAMDEYIVQIIITSFGIVTAIITASSSYYFSKKNQIEADERRLKEKHYLEYIQAVSDMVVTTDKEKARTRLAEAQNQLLLIGSSYVVKSVLEFHDYVKPSNQEQREQGKDKHDILLTEIMKAMRCDLYKSKKINNGYPIIHLSGRS